MPQYQPRQETFDEAADRLRTIVDESVAIHAMADAPIGAFLSGGIDSSGIVALTRRHVTNLRTYTLRFPDLASDDEVKEARELAAIHRCHHTTVDVTSREVRKLLPRFAGDLDQPSSDGLNTWLISRAAAQDVKGVLSGLGGDEWFSGYPVTRRMARYQETTGGRMQALFGEAAHLLGGFIPRGWLRERANNLATRRSSVATWIHTHSVLRAELARRMTGFRNGRTGGEASIDALLSHDTDDWRSETAVGLSCLLDVRVYMANQLLRDSDAASMAHSLELRVPFVDVPLAEFSRSCADDYKLSSGGGKSDRYDVSGSKRVLIHALRDVLPADIAQRPKRGFGLPYERWMRGELADLVDETCGEEAVRRRGLLDPDMVRTLRHGASNGHSGRMFPDLWSLMIFELWCRTLLDPSPESTRAGRPVGVA